MRTNLLTLAVLAGIGLVAGCANESGPTTAAGGVSEAARTQAAPSVARSGGTSTVASAALPAHTFATIDTTAEVVHRGATTLHPVLLSESNAIEAIANGEMTMSTPDGVPVRLKYERHAEHDDGNWTWVGNVDGHQGTKAVLTFGEKAVFGQIQLANGKRMEVTTRNGRAYVTDTDMSKIASDPGGPEAIALEGQVRSTVAAAQAKSKSVASMPRTQTAAAAIASNTIDIVLGYTPGYVTFLGGQSQAITRLNNLVDITNQAYVDSKVNGAVRLVKTVLVNYPDNTSNETALFELTGVSCVGATPGQMRLPNRGVSCEAAAVPAALQPLVTAREQFGADLVSLVRVFNNPENGSCGTAWVLGGAQTALDNADAPFGYSVVSDSNGVPDDAQICRNEYLAHELGHNMGLQHDIATAQGADDSNTDGNLLDPEEYGWRSYGFGYNASVAQGDFYTVMALRRTGQNGFVVFANPNISCVVGTTSFPCGVAASSDNARALNEAMPIVANFRTSAVTLGGNWLRGDFNGDHRADVLWRNNTSGVNTIWLGAGSGTQQAVSSITNLAWDIAGVGDFDGDGRSDLLWRNSISGQNTIWRSGNSAAQTTVSSLAAGWQVVGVGDFNGDNRDDILWRNAITGGNVIWRSGSSATGQFLTSVPDQNWQPVGIGDFNADNRDDILWHNTVTGGNTVWLAGNGATTMYVTSVPNTAWIVAGVADFNGDHKADIIWRNRTSGINTLWLGGNSTTQQYVSSVPTTWMIVAPGDFNNDGKADLFWRNTVTGANTIWLGGNATTQQPVSSISNFAWAISG